MLFKQLIEGQHPGATFKASGRWFSGFVGVIMCPSEGNTCCPETTGGCDTTEFSSSYIKKVYQKGISKRQCNHGSNPTSIYP